LGTTPYITAAHAPVHMGELHREHRSLDLCALHNPACQLCRASLPGRS